MSLLLLRLLDSLKGYVCTYGLKLYIFTDGKHVSKHKINNMKHLGQILVFITKTVFGIREIEGLYKKHYNFQGHIQIKMFDIS